MTVVRSIKSWLVAVGIAAILAVPAGLTAQDGTLTGTVTATGDVPLPGVSVTLTDLGLSALTGIEGNYTLTGVPAGTHEVQAARIGYGQSTATVTLGAGETATLNFEMAIQALQLEGVVAVGYGATRDQLTLTGAVSSVQGEVLEIAPVQNMSNAIAGRLPGVIMVNTSGNPGADDSRIRIRGSSTLNDNEPLVVIDGVPDRAGGFERLTPQDIENISVLKDASAAIYGSRAANGVILITTKRGVSGSPPQFTLNFNQGYNQPTRIPEMADAATYMTMLNEVDIYRNRAPRFTEERIQNHADPNADPWLYPNTDWFAAALKDRSLQTRGTLAVRGGTDQVRYYLSLGGQTQDGYYVNSATRYNQYNFRSNLDADPTDNLSFSFDVTGRLEDRNYASRSDGEIFRMLVRGKPHEHAYFPNGLPGPDLEHGDNPVVIGTPATGYDDDKRYYIQGNLGLNYQVPFVDGLGFRGSAVYDQQFRNRKIWRTPWTLYSWDRLTYDDAGVPVLAPSQKGFSSPELSQRSENGHDILLTFLADYQRSFGEHSFNFLGGAERQTSENAFISALRRFYVSDRLDEIFAGSQVERENDGSSGVAARQNYFTRVNYDYAQKYLVELVGRYDGSYIFPREGRFGFFPSASLGWRISEEDFFRNSLPIFNELKLRTSFGQTGNDRIDEWQYLPSFAFGNGYVFGVDGEVPSVSQTRTPNPNVTWEVANQFNVGADGRVLDNRLSFSLDYFRERRTDILHFRNASVPQSTGLSLPRENIGEVESWGWDGSVSWRQDLAPDASFTVTLNGGYNDNKITFWDEPAGAPDHQRSTGSRMNTPLYYVAIGVFEDQAAIDAYPSLPEARPGDLIFKDVNGDGVINDDDRVRMDKNSDPKVLGGVTLAGTRGSFDFTIFFQGAAGAAQYIATQSGEFGNYLQDFAANRWTPDNPTASGPRAFSRNDEYWMSRQNTHFYRNNDYIRLKTLEVGYRLPDNIQSRLGVQNMRVYLSGFNLLTWDKFKVFDPESRNTTGSFYPQTRVFNMGTSLSF